MKRSLCKVLLAALCVVMLASSCSQEKKAKYVFYFIGDGMGFSHISLTEGYLATKEGKIGNSPLCFTQFPVMGMATSYSANRYITCSSAAGTALATGCKTNNGMLGVTPDSSNLVSIAYKIHNAGFPVGITTSVTIDHATPASFYANSAARSDYYSIAEQLASSDFEFFGGGGFYGAKDKREQEKSLYDIASQAGYEFAYGVDEYEAKKGSSDKMILFQKGEKKNNDLPYVAEREDGDLTLPQVVESAVDFLNNQNGFFLMVEGGKIDWAAHSNDLAGTIFEMLDFDQAIAAAYEFYKQHPDETLIVVTADHETGGVTLGRGKGYVYDLSVVGRPQKGNVEGVSTDVSNYMSGVSVDSLSKVAKIGWTTTSHTGGAVPVFAVGAGSGLFAGRQDNTDIPKKICKAMGVEF